MTPEPRTKRSEAALAGLKRSHQRRRNNSVEIVRRAITRLKETNSPVSLGRIARMTRELSETGVGVSESTILRNPECRQLYEEAAQPVRRRHTIGHCLDSKVATPTDTERRRANYLMRWTKAQLSAHIIAIERELSLSEKANCTLREKILKNNL
ncbi:hypothetical protein [Onishia niordana]|uniref:hypothetical protein n=1 Tax=Onishia niordana TaxID=2508711 RepID=UPI0010A0415C|nr:hypothetical protein [Halomonas niordiana]